MKTYLTYGAYSAIVTALLNLGLYFTGYQTEKLASGQNFQWVGIAMFLLFILLGMREVRDARGDQGLSYPRALGTGLMITLFTGLFSALYSFFHFTFINPEYAQYAIQMTRTQLEAKGNIPADQIDKIVEISAVFLKPWIIASMSLFGSLLMGLLASLITGIFVKRAPLDAAAA